jgi:RND family efflux transporter MFP subunit
LVVLLGLGIAAWYYRVRAAEPKHEAGAAVRVVNRDVSANPLVVATVRPAKGGIALTSSQIGSVHPYQEADLFAKISGYLKALHVDYGSRVKRGQLLAEIDDPEVQKEADRAAAALVQSRAAVRQAKARVESAIADKKAADAAVEQAKADIDRFTSARKYRAAVLKRHQDLVAKRAIPQEVADEDLDNYESSMSAERSARAAAVTAQAQASAAQAKIDQAEADVAEAEAKVEVDEANLAKARVFVDYMKITSPYDGVITRREFFPGAFIRSAAEGNTVPLLSVARTDRVRVVTHIQDRYVPYTDVGDPAEVTLDSLAPEVFKGKVSRFADKEDPASRTMYTEIDLPNANGRIRPGMYGIAKVFLDRAEKASTLPAKCLVGEAEGDKGSVFVIKDGKARRTPIKIGVNDGIRVEVLSGLDPEDEVIVDTTGVAEGTPVRPLHATETSTQTQDVESGEKLTHSGANR